MSVAASAWDAPFNRAFRTSGKQALAPRDVRASVQEFTRVGRNEWVCEWLDEESLRKGDTFLSTSQSASFSVDPRALQSDPWIEYSVGGEVVCAAHPFQGYPHRGPHPQDGPLFRPAPVAVHWVWVFTGDFKTVKGRARAVFARAWKKR